MIIKMTSSNMKDYNKSNHGFIVSGKIIPTYKNKVWTFTEEIGTEPFFKKYEDDEIDLSYINDMRKPYFFTILNPIV